MKISINKKIFLDKTVLQKSLPQRLKKPIQALASKKVKVLPFYYENNHFEDGSGFIAIGETKELHRIFKTERVKGNGGKDKKGKVQKIDKKNVGYGQVLINDQGVFEFQLEGGFMKKLQAKAVINSLTILKQTIGQNFIITKGDAPVKDDSKKETPTSNSFSDTNAPSQEAPTTATTELQAKKAKRKIDMIKMKANLEKISALFD